MIRALLFITFLASTLPIVAQDVKEISNVKIFYLPTDLRTRVSVSESSIKNMELTKTIELNDIQSIEKRINKLRLKKRYKTIDIRLMCEVKYTDGSLDNLSFDSHKKVFYKNEVYRKNIGFYNLIYSSLP
jgi:lantibiotic modifying enzyme